MEASNTDALTGLFNRRCFDKALDDQLIAGRPFCLGLIDLDNFKSINDTHGHPVGDDVLRAVAREGRQIAGQEATLYRYGGEELAIIIPGRTAPEHGRCSSSGAPRWHSGHGANRNWRVGRICRVGLWRPGVRRKCWRGVDQALYQARMPGKNRCTMGLIPGTASASPIVLRAPLLVGLTALNLLQAASGLARNNARSLNHARP